tara:strand:- start:2080 stop:2304 length:225 start_codon:yes stop_codon:yes gene_type:complete
LIDSHDQKESGANPLALINSNKPNRLLENSSIIGVNIEPMPDRRYDNPVNLSKLYIRLKDAAADRAGIDDRAKL